MKSVQKKVISVNKIKNSKILFYLLWIILIFWRIPLLNNGIDYTDTGFNLANYHNAFFGNGINGIGLFLTNLLGGIIYKILPSHHLLVFRILHWAIYVTVDIVTYKIFKKYLNRNIILIVLLALNLGSNAGEGIFSYYPLTKLFLIPAIGTLISGITEKKGKLIFLSGVLCGINVFVRLPNILFCIMAIGIIVYGIWEKEDKKIIAKRVLIYICGAALGFASVLAVIILYMGLDKSIESFMGYVYLAIGKSQGSVENFLGVYEESGHSVFAIIKNVIKQCIFAVRDVVFYGLPMLLVNFVFCKLTGKKPTKSKIYIALSSVISIMFFAFFSGSIASRMDCVRVLFMYAMLIIMLFGYKKINKEHSLIYLITFVLGICCIFGSDLGLHRVGMLQGIVALVIVLAIYDCKEFLIFDKKAYADIFDYILKPSAILIILAAYVVSVSTVMTKTYNDAPVLDMTASVNESISVLKGMETSEIRAEEIDEYYRILSSEDLKDKEVAIFGYFPLGYVISGQTDYFESIQPCIDYPAISVESLLSVIETKKEQNIYPIIVLSHINALQRGDDHDTSKAKIAVMNYMLNLTEYDCLTDDDYFTVYAPKD